jgi:hypothetical protein
MTEAWIEDDSDVIDVIESAEAAWLGSHEINAPTDERTDECINTALGLPPLGAIRPLADEFADWSQDGIRAAVERGLENWSAGNSISGVTREEILAVEYYDQLPVGERAAWRENATISPEMRRELDAIDAGRKAPCLS